MYYDKELLNNLYGATNITVMSKEYSLILNSIKHKLLYARSVDPTFNDNNYMFVIGNEIFYEIKSELIKEGKQYKLFGINVLIDYYNSKDYKLYKEVD